ncbi:MAG: hypothetical protein WC789_09510 [Lentisphaeria bacterium]
MSTYSEKLKDPRWQKKRLEVMQRDEFRCVECGASDQTLNVHHAYYVRGREPWEYPDESLHTLCEPCHETRQEATDELREKLGHLSTRQIRCLIPWVDVLIRATWCFMADNGDAPDCVLDAFAEMSEVVANRDAVQ